VQGDMGQARVCTQATQTRTCAQAFNSNPAVCRQLLSSTQLPKPPRHPSPRACAPLARVLTHGPGGGTCGGRGPTTEVRRVGLPPGGPALCARVALALATPGAVIQDLPSEDGAWSSSTRGCKRRASGQQAPPRTRMLVAPATSRTWSLPLTPHTPGLRRAVMVLAAAARWRRAHVRSCASAFRPPHG